MTRRQARRSAERPYGGGRVGGDDDYTAPTPSATTDTGPGSAAAMRKIFGACTPQCDPGLSSYNTRECHKCKGRRGLGLSTSGEDYRRDTSHYYPSESIENTDLYGIVLEELQAVLAELETTLKEGQNKYVVTVADEKLVGTFDYSRLEDKRFLPNQAGETLGLTAGSRVPNGTKMVDNLPPMR
jgi:hypothetical protein